MPGCPKCGSDYDHVHPEDYDEAIADLRKQLAEKETESEGRRKTLDEKSTELRLEWTRAEKAEAERDEAKALFEKYAAHADSLQSALLALQAERDKLREEARIANKGWGIAKSAHAEVYDELDKLRADLQAATEANAALRAENVTLAGRVDWVKRLSESACANGLSDGHFHTQPYDDCLRTLKSKLRLISDASPDTPTQQFVRAAVECAEWLVVEWKSPAKEGHRYKRGEELADAFLDAKAKVEKVKK